jgi:hypothetical protein
LWSARYEDDQALVGLNGYVRSEPTNLKFEFIPHNWRLLQDLEFVNLTLTGSSGALSISLNEIAKLLGVSHDPLQSLLSSRELKSET